ncbi:MAG: glycosyltransferase family 39 protein [Thermoanaerobaculia bacterium]
MKSPSESPPQTPLRSRSTGLLLATVLVLGFGLRLWLVLDLPFLYDDHYVINNISTVLDGSLVPIHTMYGSLSYLPQALALAACDRLHAWTGISGLAVRGSEVEDLTLGAYRIARMFVLAYGMLSLLMIYFVGRRLFSPMIGVAAAAVLSAYPRHVRSSADLKPDMLALLLTLVTLYWTVGATRVPRLSRFLLAGLGVGLAVSAKYTGVASALPLTVWALATGFRDRRRWGWLFLSGLTAVATYVILNPFVGKVLFFAPRLVNGYAKHARQDGSDHLTVLRGEVEFLALQHGWFLGALLLLGTVLLIYRLWRPAGPEWIPALLLLSLGLGYPALYAAGMTLLRRQNLLPALAAVALVCAYGMIRCGQWVFRRLPPVRAPGLAAIAGLLTCGLVLAQPFEYTYAQVVPKTWVAATEALSARLAPVGARQLAIEPEDFHIKLAEDWKQATMSPAPSLAALSPALLDLMDAEVFPLSRTLGPEAAFYQRRQQRVARECRLEIHTQWFRRRGIPLVLLLHPWTPAGDPIQVDFEQSSGPPGDLVARLPGSLAAGDILSIELVAPDDEDLTAVTLQPGGQSLPLEYAGHHGQRFRFLTPRFRYAAETQTRLSASDEADPESFRLLLWRWKAPQAVASPSETPDGAPTIKALTREQGDALRRIVSPMESIGRRQRPQ